MPLWAYGRPSAGRSPAGLIARVHYLIARVYYVRDSLSPLQPPDRHDITFQRELTVRERQQDFVLFRLADLLRGMINVISVLPAFVL